ncbi:MAG TPA: 2-oxoacid:acceptor oxidoreductase family protein [Phycisphaerae bacterium]|nr:2-oxoacid:acceptor oxidoreductase family protein [Phycisphaerae bacterium]
MDDHRVIFSGSGGQGLMFIGKLLANLALDGYPHVTFLPSYGAEVRGGTSNCQVVLSEEPIPSPVVDLADAEVLMNQPSVDRFLPRLAAGGRAFVNASMASAAGGNVLMIPASQIAQNLGGVQAANIVMFGAYLRHAHVIGRDKALEGIEAISRPKGPEAAELNARAFEEGWGYLG